MITLYLVRHGQTGWNAEGRLQGQADTGLNALGGAQAAENGRRLAKLVTSPASFDFVASPLLRTRRTMELLRAAMGLPEDDYRTDSRLLELHFGDWQGHTFPELELDDPGCFTRREADKWTFVPPGADAESYEMLEQRVRPWLEALSRDTICVTHGGVIRTVFRLTETMGAAECGALAVHQDRVLKLKNGRLDWL